MGGGEVRCPMQNYFMNRLVKNSAEKCWVLVDAMKYLCLGLFPNMQKSEFTIINSLYDDFFDYFCMTF